MLPVFRPRSHFLFPLSCRQTLVPETTKTLHLKYLGRIKTATTMLHLNMTTNKIRALKRLLETDFFFKFVKINISKVSEPIKKAKILAESWDSPLNNGVWIVTIPWKLTALEQFIGHMSANFDLCWFCLSVPRGCVYVCNRYSTWRWQAKRGTLTGQRESYTCPDVRWLDLIDYRNDKIWIDNLI